VSQQINLFNPIFLKQKRQFSALAMAQALGVVTLGALAIYAYEVRQNRVLADALRDTEKQLEARREQITRFGREFSSQAASRTLSADLAAAEARLEARRGLLNEVKTGVAGDAQGYSRYLSALARQAMPGVWITGVDIGGKAGTLTIKGRALDSAHVPAYLRALNREAPIAGRRIDELRLAAKEAPARPAAGTQAPALNEPERYIEFSLALPLRGEL
jgi:Tfp pilus assembly protein PilN